MDLNVFLRAIKTAYATRPVRIVTHQQLKAVILSSFIYERSQKANVLIASPMVFANINPLSANEEKMHEDNG